MSQTTTDRKRKADVIGRLNTSSKLGRGSLSGWTACPLCPPHRKKQYALGRGIAAHLHAVHAPWKVKRETNESSKRKRLNEDSTTTSFTNIDDGNSTCAQQKHLVDEWAQHVAELTAKLEQEYKGKPGLDRTGKTSKSYRESLPTFLQAAADGDLSLLRSILSKASHSKEEIEILLSTRDRNGSTPEHWAAGGGHLDCLKFLLESRESRRKPAAASCDQAARSTLKKQRRRDGKTCLHFAARNGKLDCLRYLVEERCHSVEIRSGDGTTPLHLACFGAHLSSVQYLIDKGANVCAINDWSCSAAHWTAMSQSQDADALISICQLLHKAGVSFIEAQKQGHSPLHKAAQKKNRIVVQWLSKSIELGGPGLSQTERQRASQPDGGGHRPSDIWISAGGDSDFGSWIKEVFED